MWLSVKHVLSITCTVAALFAAGTAAAQTEKAAYDVTVTVMVGENQMGVHPGEQIFLDFMLDPDLSPTRSLSIQSNVRVFIDPWRWHWRLWDWLRTFIIRIPRIPDPGPDPGPLTIEAVFDDAQDMIMEMPGSPPLARGSAFMTRLEFPSDSPFFREGRVPTLQEMIEAKLVRGQFSVVDPEGKPLLVGTAIELRASKAAEPCPGDIDGDGDVDATDAVFFRRDFGRRNCPLM